MRKSFFNRGLSFFKSLVRVKYERLRGKKIVHYVHIGKTAGTTIKNTLGDYNKKTGRKYYFNVRHSHNFKYGDIPESDFFLFSIRDPVKRFYSGFYSRKRMGMPRIYNPYSPGEERAFSLFDHANDLAEAMTSSDCNRKMSAICAMREIGHVKTSYWNWFRGAELFEDVRLVGVIEQTTLEKDLYEMLGRLGINDEIEVPTDAVTTHKNDYKDVPQLTDLAKKNLKEWYSQDYYFISLCEIWKSQIKSENK